jgi:hypothetical protein
MSASGSKSLPAVGFLSVREVADGGFCGGFLVLNASGRPLEFHCTAPVAPNRAQQILYGPTLKPFLFGEQIGQTLVSRSKVSPLLLLTDSEPALALRAYCEAPLVCVLTEDQDGAGRLGRTPVQVDRAHPRDLEAAQALWSQHFQTLDLSEPFDRIGEALEESRKVA